MTKSIVHLLLYGVDHENLHVRWYTIYSSKVGHEVTDLNQKSKYSSDIKQYILYSDFTKAVKISRMKGFAFEVM